MAEARYSIERVWFIRELAGLLNHVEKQKAPT
jgi:hypothetical protein